MFSRFGIRVRLLVAFSFCSLILAFVGYVSYVKLVETIASYHHIVRTTYPHYVALSQIVDQGRRLNIIAARVTGSALNNQEIKVLEDEFNSTAANIETQKQAYLAVPFVQGEEAIWTNVDERLKVCVAYIKQLLEMPQTFTPEDQRKRDAFANGYEKVRVPYREAMAKLMTLQTKETEKWSKLAETSASRGRTIILILVCFGVGCSLIVGFAMSMALNRTMSRIAHELAHGADEVASASSEISSTAEQLSSSSIEQASAIQETASSVEEMSSMVRKNAENAKRSADVAQEGQNTAAAGKQVITEMLSAMNEIDAATREIADVVKLIGQIENKTKVIDDIVFKTQLLSFNASVEAARAGEHGKGFAVVAEEVGNLAQMSGNAAREISEMLSQSLERVDRMITSSKQKVEVGLSVGKRCGEVLDELVEKVSEISDMSNDIANASDEQARGVIEINKAMTQMDQMTQQNAAAAQQSASSSEDLSNQAESLRISVTSLLEVLNGNREVAELAPPARVKMQPPTKSSKKTRGQKAAAVKPKRKSKSDSIHKTPSGEHPGFDDAA